VSSVAPLPPPSGTPDAVADALREVREGLSALRACVVAADGDDEVLLEALRGAAAVADQAAAVTVAAVGAARAAGSTERAAGLSVDHFLGLAARRTRGDARGLVRLAAVLDTLPVTAGLFADGTLSYSQVREIAAFARDLRVEQRVELDGQVAADAAAGVRGDPDWVVDRAGDLVARVRADLTGRREDRGVEASFVAVQPRLDGGGSGYFELDAVSMATVLEGLDAAADAPGLEDADGPLPARRRGGQLADGFVRLSAFYLAHTGHPCADATPDTGTEADDGGAPGSAPGCAHRAKPTLYATVDVATLAGVEDHSARLLWRMVGAPPRLTATSARVLACDAKVIPVLVDTTGVLAVGEPTDRIPVHVRRGVIVRDGGCRMPGCRAPAAWCDAHHIISREDGGPPVLTNLVNHEYVPSAGTYQPHKQRRRSCLHAPGHSPGAAGQRASTTTRHAKAPSEAAARTMFHRAHRCSKRSRTAARSGMASGFPAAWICREGGCRCGQRQPADTPVVVDAAASVVLPADDDAGAQLALEPGGEPAHAAADVRAGRLPRTPSRAGQRRSRRTPSPSTVAVTGGTARPRL
jgi:hypothetical protein